MHICYIGPIDAHETCGPRKVHLELQTCLLRRQLRQAAPRRRGFGNRDGAGAVSVIEKEPREVLWGVSRTKRADRSDVL